MQKDPEFVEAGDGDSNYDEDRYGTRLLWSLGGAISDGVDVTSSNDSIAMGRPQLQSAVPS
jgi:hypothetical protein